MRLKRVALHAIMFLPLSLSLKTAFAINTVVQTTLEGVAFKLYILVVHICGFFFFHFFYAQFSFSLFLIDVLLF
jgi:hypothetical protein